MSFKSILYSTLLHVLFLGVFLWFQRAAHRQLPLNPEPVKVDLIGSGATSSGGGGSLKQGKRLRKQEKARSKLDQLKVPFDPLGARRKSGEGSQSIPGDPLGSRGSGGQEDGFSEASAMSLETEAERYPFMRLLRKRIDQNLTYPEDFVKERITGTVDLEFQIDRQGRIQKSITVLGSENTALQALSAVTVYHSLTEPLPEKYWLPEQGAKPYRIVARFHFAVFGVGENTESPHPEQFKNLLYFSRFGYVDPKLNQAIEKLISNYIPPIIVLPGAFYIDFYRLYRFVENLRNRGKIEDPGDRRKSRIELQVEEMKRMIQKKTESHQ